MQKHCYCIERNQNNFSSLSPQAEESADSLVIDIDADVSDPFTVSEYANEIFINMKSREVGLLYIHTYIHTYIHVVNFLKYFQSRFLKYCYPFMAKSTG